MLRAIATIAVLAGVFAVLPAAADAAISGVELRTAQEQLSGSTAEVDSQCASTGPNEVAVGGGVRWVDPVNVTANRILGIDPAFPGGNRSTVHDYDVGGTDTAVSIALCARASEVPPVTPRLSQVSFSTGEPAVANCEIGEVAIGGGVRPSSRVAPGERSISESQPTGIIGGGAPTSWRTRYTNTQSATEGFRAVALCVDDSFEAEVASSSPVTQPAGALAVATAQCEGDTAAIGGGVRWLPGSETRNGLVASQPGALVAGQPRSWTVIGVAPASAGAQQLQAFAICARLGEPTTSPRSVGFASPAKLEVSRAGVVRPRLSCDAPEGERCAGVLRLTGRKGKARRQVRASASFSIAPSKTAGVRLLLSRKANPLVRRAGRRGVRATATASLGRRSSATTKAVRLVAKR